jgi:hypothetical protein
MASSGPEVFTIGQGSWSVARDFPPWLHKQGPRPPLVWPKWRDSAVVRDGQGTRAQPLNKAGVQCGAGGSGWRRELRSARRAPWTNTRGRGSWRPVPARCPLLVVGSAFFKGSRDVLPGRSDDDRLASGSVMLFARRPALVSSLLALTIAGPSSAFAAGPPPGRRPALRSRGGDGRVGPRGAGCGGQDVSRPEASDLGVHEDGMAPELTFAAHERRLPIGERARHLIC